MSLPKNLILFGPPGTGKTRETVTKALGIFAEYEYPGITKNVQGEDYNVQLNLFKDLVEKGYIKFVTFHQSFSYEDFVEGIRAEVSEDKVINYKVADGIFKELCNNDLEKIKSFCNQEEIQNTDDMIHKVNGKQANPNMSPKGEIDKPRKNTNINLWLAEIGVCVHEGICRSMYNAYWLDISEHYLIFFKNDAASFCSEETKKKQKNMVETLNTNVLTNKIKNGDIIIAFQSDTTENGKSEIKIVAHGIVSKQCPAEKGKNKVEYIMKWASNWINPSKSTLLFNDYFNIAPSTNDSFLCKVHSNQIKEEAKDNLKKIIKNNINDDRYKEVIDNLSIFQEKNSDKPIKNETDDSKPTLYPRVMIIDEINRGNISRIFGELITLIEETHREPVNPKNEVLETLSVTLPYSREKFTIPENVYIIGTMNTADRSLTGLDIALRRRFSFEEMVPDYTALEGIEIIDKESDVDKNSQKNFSINELLETINQRIEIMLDKDHCIGHAPFIALKKADDKLERLGEIFKNNIIPLLQEYFFDDWKKIHVVLYGNKATNEGHLLSYNTINSSAITQTNNQNKFWQVNDNFEEFEAYNQMFPLENTNQE